MTGIAPARQPVFPVNDPEEDGPGRKNGLTDSDLREKVTDGDMGVQARDDM